MNPDDRLQTNGGHARTNVTLLVTLIASQFLVVLPATDEWNAFVLTAAYGGILLIPAFSRWLYIRGVQDRFGAGQSGLHPTHLPRSIFY